MKDILYDEIPSLDLADFTSGTPDKREGFVQKLGEAYNNIGFVAIKNHGLDKELQDKLYAVIKKFFSLPDDVKVKYEKPEIGFQRGYTGKGKEHAKGRNTGDLKEFYHVGQELDSIPDSDETKKELALLSPEEWKRELRNRYLGEQGGFGGGWWGGRPWSRDGGGREGGRDDGPRTGQPPDGPPLGPPHEGGFKDGGFKNGGKGPGGSGPGGNGKGPPGKNPPSPPSPKGAFPGPMPNGFNGPGKEPRKETGALTPISDGKSNPPEMIPPHS